MKKLLPFLALAVGLAACEKPPVSETPPAPHKRLAPCSGFKKCTFYVEVDQNDVATIGTGSCERCFEYFANLTLDYHPALGHISFSSDVEICSFGFGWLPTGTVGGTDPGLSTCPFPDYTWTITQSQDPNGQPWTGTVSFAPDECIAEHVPALLQFTFLIACPN